MSKREECAKEHDVWLAAYERQRWGEDKEKPNPHQRNRIMSMLGHGDPWLHRWFLRMNSHRIWMTTMSGFGLAAMLTAMYRFISMFVPNLRGFGCRECCRHEVKAK